MSINEVKNQDIKIDKNTEQIEIPKEKRILIEARHGIKIYYVPTYKRIEEYNIKLKNFKENYNDTVGSQYIPLPLIDFEEIKQVIINADLIPKNLCSTIYSSGNNTTFKITLIGYDIIFEQEEVMERYFNALAKLKYSFINILDIYPELRL